jgi:AMMECR1 domain-containing protein
MCPCVAHLGPIGQVAFVPRETHYPIALDPDLRFLSVKLGEWAHMIQECQIVSAFLDFFMDPWDTVFSVYMGVRFLRHPHTPVWELVTL